MFRASAFEEMMSFDDLKRQKSSFSHFTISSSQYLQIKYIHWNRLFNMIDYANVFWGMVTFFLLSAHFWSNLDALQAEAWAV